MKTIKVMLTFKKSTKGTHVYMAPGTAVPTIYIRKSSMLDAPNQLILTINTPEGEVK